jgi:hypothetical protein
VQFKLVVLLLVAACAQSLNDLEDELISLTNEVENTLTFPEPAPIFVGRNKRSAVSRAVATSSLPFWSLIVIGFCGAFAVLGLATLLFALCSSDIAKSNKTFGVIFSVCLLVAGVIGIVTAVAVGLSTPAPNGLSRGARFAVGSGIMRVVSIKNKNVWRIVVLDSKVGFLFFFSF